YRSAVFVTDEAQRAAAEAVIKELSDEQVFPDPIVTEVTDAGPFYRAEPIHDDYFARNPNAGYCRVVIAPKVAKIRKQCTEQPKASTP
ncbi:peptide-methionine (S)-S-oxide reductase, partial [bacterium]|nr:peptide-methionine (S)-S-oxide reductase [bacterium]